MMTKTTYDAKNNCAQNTIAHNTVLKINFQINTVVSFFTYIGTYEYPSHIQIIVHKKTTHILKYVPIQGGKI